MKIKTNLLVTCLFLFTALISVAQTNTTGAKYEVSGKVTDNLTGEPLVGANVIYEKGKGVQTDVDGAYVLLLPDGKYTLQITYIGYAPITQKITVNGSNQTVEPQSLANNNNLDEVEIAADVARTHETPVAFSDIDQKQISEELGANDITMLLNTTPGAYATQQGGGTGDSRVNIRGFDQRNIAVLIDGIPVNDMENGQVYWSNWAGLAEVTKKLQVQRGIGASRLAVPSVGGVMNIITTPVDHKQFFTVKENLGTNNFQRYSAAYNSGLIKNKLGITLAASYSTGDGYIDQTWQKSWSYFGKISYKINEKNLLILGFSGAPQSHAQRSFALNMVYNDKAFAEKQGINADSVYASNNKYTTALVGARGLKYNPDWGYLNGKPFTAKVNTFYKPLMNLSYFLTINNRLSFSNVLYYSSGRGGGTALTNYQYDRFGTGQLSIQALYDPNFNSASNPFNVLQGQKESTYIQYSSINNHDWVGTLATLKYRQSSKLDYMGGVDARYYVGTHYQTPTDLLGGDYFKTTRVDLTSDTSRFALVKKVGDKINYYYQSHVSWVGLFGQAEYKSKHFTAFFTATGNQTGYQTTNYFARKDIVVDNDHIYRQAVGYGETFYTDGVNHATRDNRFAPKTNADGSIYFNDVVTKHVVTLQPNYKTYDMSSSKARTNESAVKSYIGYTLKGGLNYKLDRNHNVFANLGHMDLAPRFTNVFDRTGKEVQGVTNQKVFTGELGYNVKYSNIALTLNGYITSWGNKPLDFPGTQPDEQTNSNVYYNINGVNALLKGIEMQFTYKPVKYLEWTVFGMMADWKWNSAATGYIYNASGDSVIKSFNFDATGVHLANAPQQQLGTSIRYELTRGFYIKPQFTYFGKMYAQFDPSALTNNEGGKDYRKTESWRMPSYGLFDLYVGYRMMANKTKIELTASMNNVLNTVYISDATFVNTGVSPDRYNALTSVGWLGLGRRINIGAKITF